jgi:hypothetical protein
MRPAEIARLLDERFRLLTHGRADVALRHQTLQATVEWSYTLLSGAERRIFDGLGVFPGTFDAPAAATVVGADGLERWDILDGLHGLVGKSMVAEDEGPDQMTRYHLLETMRAYARQRLTATGQLDRLQSRHAEYYAAFAEEAGPELLGPRQLDWQGRIRVELDNLRVAVMWALTSSGQAHQVAFRIVSALAFSAASRRDDVGVWAERALSQVGTCPPGMRATVIAAAAWSAYFAGDLPLALERAEDALREPPSSDPNSHGMPQALLSQIYARTGQPELGARIARKARQEFVQQGNEVYAGYLLAMEATAWIIAGEVAAAREPAIQAVEIARRIQNPALSTFASYAAAHAVRLQDPETALKLIEDCLTQARAGSVDSILGFALSLAAAIRIHIGDLRGALTELYEAIVQQHGDGNRLGLGLTLERGAALLARLDEAEPAAVLAGAVMAHFAVTTANVPAQERAEIDEAHTFARCALTGDAYNAALARGASMDDEEVAGYALGQFRGLLDRPIAQ